MCCSIAALPNLVNADRFRYSLMTWNHKEHPLDYFLIQLCSHSSDWFNESSWDYQINLLFILFFIIPNCFWLLLSLLLLVLSMIILIIISWANFFHELLFIILNTLHQSSVGVCIICFVIFYFSHSRYWVLNCQLLSSPWVFETVVLLHCCLGVGLMKLGYSQVSQYLTWYGVWNE